MSFQFRTIDRTKLYASIVDQIVDGVRAGAFLPGRPLPAERALAAQLGVSRSSLREAIRVLEHVCAEYAAVHRHRRDVESLRAKIHEHAELNARGEDPEEVDLAFHLGIA